MTERQQVESLPSVEPLENCHGHVYVITNTVNGKRYVGQTKLWPWQRWEQHVRVALTRPDYTMPLTLAIRKYGREAFIQITVRNCRDQKELDTAEIETARELGTIAPGGYNLRVGSGPGTVSEELRSRMSENFPEEVRERFRREYAGRPWSPLAYQRSAEAKQGTYTLHRPDGGLVTIVNMARFMREYGGETRLHGGLLIEVAKGYRWRHQGWYIVAEEEESWPRTEEVGEHLFRCPRCSSEWSSISRRHASIHVRKCNRLWIATHRAHELGNITDEAYRERLVDLARPQKMEQLPWKPNSYPHALHCRLIDPNGGAHEVRNLRHHCRTHGLSYGMMYRVVRGINRQHRGWRLAAPTDPPQ